MKTHRALVLLIVLVFISCSEKKNMRVGDSIVERIESYKSTYGHLPFSLRSVGYEPDVWAHSEQTEESVDTLVAGVSVINLNGEVFCYERIDNDLYILWFGTRLGEGLYYYSDTKRWENTPRGINHQ